MRETFVFEWRKWFSAPVSSVGALEDDEEAFDSEKPRHKVILTRDFMIGKYQVTQALWKWILTPELLRCAPGAIECVSWFDS